MRHERQEWLEHQRRRWLRPDAQRWMRPDAYRWGAEGQYFGASDVHFDRKYRPDQPRVPSGSPDGGQWIGEGGASQGNSVAVEESRRELAPMVLAGFRPRIPKERPPTGPERTAVAKGLAIWLAERAVDVTDIADFVASKSWLFEALPSIRSYLDGPKTLDELQNSAAASRPGYDIHHIVERSSAVEDGYPRRQIDAADNLVSIPRMKHWEINAWYQARNPSYGDVSPRDYLRGKDWGERRRVGLDALARRGVLKP
jgi:hypothetical protein